MLIADCHAVVGHSIRQINFPTREMSGGDREIMGKAMAHEASQDSARHDDFLRRFTTAQPALRRFILAQIPNDPEAEDILQETSLVLWRKFAQYNPEKSFTAWAMGIARNEVLHARRSASRHAKVLTDEVIDRLAERVEALAPTLDRRRSYLEHCLEKLSDRPRTVLEMHYRQGTPTERIAATLNSTVNAVRLLLYRSRQVLARCVAEAHRRTLAEGGAE